MNIVHFDINRIVKISVYGEKPVSNIQWCEPEPIKKFFGLYNTGRFKPGGYYYHACFTQARIVTEQEILNMGYKVYSRDERLIQNVVRKAHVSISLEYNESVTFSFETENEMLKWVDNIKIQSNSNFRTIIYP